MTATRRSWGALRKLPSGRWQASYRDPDLHRLAPAPETFSSKTAADRWRPRSAPNSTPARRWTTAPAAALCRTGGRVTGARCRTTSPGQDRLRDRLAPAHRASLRCEPSAADQAEPRRRVDGRMREQGVSASKVIEAVGVLKRILDRAVRDKALPANPCDQRSTTLPKRPKTDRPVLSPPRSSSWRRRCREADRVLVRRLHTAACGRGRLWRCGGPTATYRRR